MAVVLAYLGVLPLPGPIELGSPARAAGPTVVPAGDLAASQTWSPQNSPYVLPGRLRILPGATLTLLPGTIVKLTPGTNARILVAGGQLNASGTATQPITITSGADDTVGGDSNGDGTATQPAPGDWSAISFDAATRDEALDAPISIINNAVIRYGGNGSGAFCGYRAVEVGQYGRVNIARTDFTKNLYGGVGIAELDDGVGVATVSNSVFRESRCGVSANSGDVLNNIFDASLTEHALEIWRPKNLQLYGNYISKPIFSYTAATRDQADIRNNAMFAGMSSMTSSSDVPKDLSQNWWSPAVALPANTKIDPKLTKAPPAPDTGVGGVSIPSVSLPPAQVYGAGPSAYAYRSVGTQADPVNSANGAFTLPVTDAVLPALGMPLTVARAYNSVDTRAGPLGVGWSLSYDIALSKDAQNNMTLRADDGQQVKFTRNADGTYSGPPGGTAELVAAGTGHVLTNRARIRHEFNAAGQLTALKDRNNQGTAFTYSASGKLATVTGGTRTLTFMWNAAGTRVTRVDLSDGRWIGYTYDSLLRLTGVRDLLGKTTTLAYDSGNRLTTVTSPLLRTMVKVAYNSSTGRVSEQWDARNNRSTFAWDAATGTSTMTDARGGVWKDVYLNNVLYKRIDAVGGTTNYEYDADLRLLATTNPKGSRTVMAYNTAGDLVSVQGPGKPITTAYNQNHDPVSTVSGRGTDASITYDSAGNITEVTRPNPSGGTFKTTYTNDSRGLLTAATDARGNTTTYTYNADGNLTSISTGEGGKTTYVYDASGRRTKVVEPRGNVTGATAGDYTSTTAYDDGDRPTSVVNALGHNATITYDDDGRVTATRDPKLRITTFEYDADGHTTKVQGPDPAIPATTSTYDANGNQVTTTDPAGRTITYTYDLANRVTQAASPLGTYRYTYDALNNLTSSTDPADKTTRMRYDLQNRLASIDYPDTSFDVTYSYDTHGNRTAMTDRAGTVSYTYDALDQLTAVTRGSNTFKYSYDSVGNLATTTYPDNTQYAYTYDKDNRLDTVKTGATTLADYDYDPAGQQIKATLGNGAISTATYDRGGRVTRITDTKIPATLVDETYTYDAANNPTAIKHANGATDTYTYDTLDRLTKACYSTTTCTGATDYIAWAYDAVGNMTTETRPSGTVTFGYNTAGQLTSRSTPGNTTNYTYNALGQRATAGSTNYAYEPNGRLGSVTAGAAATTYTYDGDGRRLTATTAGVTTNYQWNPKTYQLALERDASDTVLRRYSYGTDRIAMTVPGSGDFYYHTDRQSSVLALTNATGTLQRQYSWEPYGGLRSTTQNSPTAPTNPMQWAGEYADTTGLTHLRARQYDPTTGQFTQTDPASGTSTSATYRYGNANPLVFVDPYGTFGLRDLHDIAADVAMFAGGAALVLGATGIGAPAVPILGAIAIGAGIVTAATGVALAYDSCVGGGKGSCADDIATAALDTAAAIPAVGALRFIARGAEASRTAKTAARSCFRSFSGDTKVLLADGTSKPIKQIAAGDKVATTDPETGRDSTQKVTHTWVHHDTFYKLVINGQPLTTTDDHPFWNATDQQWQQANQLDPGDSLLTPSQTSAIVSTGHTTEATGDAYNLTVEGTHTYYVLAGKTPVLVHNDDPGFDWDAAEEGLKDSWDPGSSDDDGYHAPRGNQAENKQFENALQEIKRRAGRDITPAERRALHDRITGQGYDYHRIVSEGEGLFGSCG
ncbi:DUF6531 domain-containing protein [Actinoplanes sp. CA-054009]